MRKSTLSDYAESFATYREMQRVNRRREFVAKAGLAIGCIVVLIVVLWLAYNDLLRNSYPRQIEVTCTKPSIAT